MILAIYGASGLGREFADLAEYNNDNRWDKIVFVDDADGLPETICGHKVYKYDDLLTSYEKDNIEFIIGIGEPSTRELLYDKVKKDGINLATLVDKSVRVSPTVKIGEGTVVCEGVTIHDGAVIGVDSLIQPMAVIGHDIHIGNHVVISAFCAPGGATIFGDRTYVGMHATILQGLNIGKDAIIGMGSVVCRDVEEGATVVGNPARQTIGNSKHKVFSK